MTPTTDYTLPFTQLLAGASALGVTLTPAQVEKIENFAIMLREWNEQVNLVSNTSADVLLQDHILDSLSVVPLIGASKLKLVDIGSGAGFPGLILAIALSNLHVTLIECTNKKARFLEEAIAHLALPERVSVLNDRAESLAHLPQLRHQYDLATCRAVGDLDLVLELTSPFLKTDGHSLLQRSYSQYEREKNNCANRLGARLQKSVFPDRATLGKERAILVFEQLTNTSPQYPRSWNKIKKPRSVT